jgi:GT2 family glycosyltransferase
LTAEALRVSVIIPNWNGLAHLPECLATLAAQSFTAFETVVVDNGSTDESVSWVAERYPGVRVITLPDNGGFSKAVNAGIRAAGGEYVALLNNDTALDAHWLQALVQALDERADYASAASMMILYHDPSRLNAAGDTFTLMHMAGKNRGCGRPPSEYDRFERVFGACAGAALYRRTLFDEIGLFDEDFFLMHEDTDFNLRGLLSGKRCLYVPQAVVRHKVGASIAAQPDPKMTRLLMRNGAFAAAKNLPIWILALWMATWPYRLFRHSFPLRPSKWSLLPSLLRQAPRRVSAEAEGLRLGFAKRRHIQRLRTVGNREILRWLRQGSGPA